MATCGYAGYATRDATRVAADPRGNEPMIQRTKSGRWKVTVQRPSAGGTRQRVCRTVDDEAAAKRLEAQLRARPGDADGQTIGTAVERYMRLHGPAMTPNEQRSRASSINTCLTGCWLADVRLDHVDVDTLETYYEQLQRGTHRPHGYRYSFHSVRVFAGLIRKSLADVVRKKWVTPEQYEAARVIGRASDAPVLDDYDLDDVRRVLAVAAAPWLVDDETKARPDVDLADVIALALATGARKGELAAIRWRDVDLDTGVVRIVAQVTRGAVKGSGWHRADTKTGDRRAVVVGEACRAMLDRRYTEQVVAAERAGVTSLDDRAVLSRSLERGLTSPERLGERWRAACKRADVSLRFHDLRHVNTSELVAAGVPAVNVAERNGWRSTEQLHKTYAHARPHGDALATSTVDAMLGRVVPRGGDAAI